MTTELLEGPDDAAYETFYPIAQIKKDLVVTSSHTDAKLRGLLRAAVRIAGQTARCVILPSRYRAIFDAPYPTGDSFGLTSKYVDRDKTIKGLSIDGPLITIESFMDGPTALVADTNYRVIRDDAAKGLGLIRWVNPDGTKERYTEKGYTVEYTAGFAPENPDTPSMRHAVFEIMAHMIETPGEINDYVPTAIPQTAMQILASFWSSKINRRSM